MITKYFICNCIFIIILLNTSARGQNEINPLIVGGVPAIKNEFPFMVSLRFECNHICGGTIYNESIIITAAHCVADGVDNPGFYQVLTGAHNISSGNEPERQLRSVKSINVHPYYNALDNDIALLYLDSALTLNEWVKPLRIPSPTQETSGQLWVTGWGLLDEEGLGLAPILQKVNVTIVSQSVCEDSYKDEAQITDYMICAGNFDDGGSDACQGDSGGPAFPVEGDPYLAGITSFGFGCARPRYPGVYTKVSKYHDWIVNDIAEEPTTTTTTTITTTTTTTTPPPVETSTQEVTSPEEEKTTTEDAGGNGNGSDSLHFYNFAILIGTIIALISI